MLGKASRGSGGEGGSPSAVGIPVQVPASGAAAAASGAPKEQELSGVKEALRRAQSHSLELRRERANLEAELAKRRTAAAAVEAKLHRLRGELLQ